MTPGRILFLGLLIVAGVLYVLNPGPEKFREFLDNISPEDFEGESGEQPSS